MAHVEVAKLSKTEKEELATVYAALLLSDAGKPVDAANIEAIAKASGNQVSSSYASLFVRALKGKKVESLLSVGGGGGGGAPAGGEVKEDKKKDEKKEDKKDAKKDDKKDTKKETKKEPVKEEPKPAEDDDMGGGLGLFDEF